MVYYMVIKYKVRHKRINNLVKSQVALFNSIGNLEYK